MDPPLASNIEIAQAAKMKRITEVAAKLGFTEDDLESYGRYKAKISLKSIEKLKGKPSTWLIRSPPEGEDEVDPDRRRFDVVADHLRVAGHHVIAADAEGRRDRLRVAADEHPERRGRGTPGSPRIPAGVPDSGLALGSAWKMNRTSSVSRSRVAVQHPDLVPVVDLEEPPDRRHRVKGQHRDRHRLVRVLRVWARVLRTSWRTVSPASALRMTFRVTRASASSNCDQPRDLRRARSCGPLARLNRDDSALLGIACPLLRVLGPLSAETSSTENPGPALGEILTSSPPCRLVAGPGNAPRFSILLFRAGEFAGQPIRCDTVREDANLPGRLRARGRFLVSPTFFSLMRFAEEVRYDGFAEETIKGRKPILVDQRSFEVFFRAGRVLGYGGSPGSPLAEPLRKD